MKVNVQFFSHLKERVPNSTQEIELNEGATVADLLAQLYAQLPALREWDKSILIGAGVEFVGRDHVLKGNEQIAIMPPVQGG